MAKVLYFIHIPWGWAKQRPQFLAEELDILLDLKVFYKQPFTFHNQSIECSKIYKRKLFFLPYQSKVKLIRSINIFFTKLYFTYKFHEYTHIWLTSPELLPYIPKLNKNQILIYDCMDDMLSFPKIRNNKKLFNFYYKNEYELINRANIIITTSANLKSVIESRYKIDKNIRVINNALSHSFFLNKSDKDLVKFPFNYNKKNIVYVGTIANWMDWELIMNSLNLLGENYCYHFFGPTEVDIPQNESIIYYGPVPHSEINRILKSADILVMPFVLNNLILSVNPVKLYEYIFSGTPSISVRYGESELFEEFVHLYSTIDEYIKIIKSITEGKVSSKKNKETAQSYCENNTWKNRAAEIMKILNENQ